MRDRWIVDAGTLAGVLLLLAALGCGGSQQSEQLQFRVPVRVKEVKTDQVEDRILATGTLRTAETVTLTVESTGLLTIEKSPVTGMRFAEGDAVRAGQLVATISGEEVRLAARTESRRRRFETNKRNYESVKRLVEEGLIASKELDDAQAVLAESRAEVDRSEYTESQRDLLSPIDGIVMELARDTKNRPLANGQRVITGFTVAVIAPLKTLIADVDLVGPDASRVRPGQVVRLRHHAWEEQGFEGKILRVAPSLDPITRAFRVEVLTDNSAGLLRPGMFVEATVLIERRIDVPVVPRRAVTERSGQKVVFVLKGQRVAQRTVRLGLGDDEIVEVVSGLEVGEKVVVKGIETLTDKSLVRVTGS